MNEKEEEACEAHVFYVSTWLNTLVTIQSRLSPPSGIILVFSDFTPATVCQAQKIAGNSFPVFPVCPLSGPSIRSQTY